MEHENINYSDDYIKDILSQVKTIALVGASRKTHRASYRVMAYLQEQGYKVIPVNPSMEGEQLLGEEVYPSLAAIDQAIDMVDIFRNSEAALLVTQAALAIKPKVIWMQNGVINHEAKSIAIEAGIKVVMDRCPKIEIPRLHMDQ